MKATKVFIVFFLIFFTFLLFVTYKRIEKALNYDKVYPQVFIGSFNVGCYTLENLQDLYKKLQSLIDNKELIFYFKDRIFKQKLKYFQVQLDKSQFLKAYREGRDTVKNKILYYYGKKTKTIPIIYTYNKEKIDEFIEHIAKDINQVPKIPVIYERQGYKFLKKGSNGLKLNEEKLREILNEIFNDLFDKFDQLDKPIGLPVVILEPQPNFEMLKKQMNLDKKMLTVWVPSGNFVSNSYLNFKIAMEKIDGLVLEPFQKFSFNKIVGPRNAEQGFVKSSSIYKGKLISTYGGGVCKAATLCYKAALYANFEILERYNHSIMFDSIKSYADVGKDAAVVWPYKDLVFRNNYPFSVLFEVEFKADKTYLTLWGAKELSTSVEIRTVILSKVKPQVKKVYDYSMPIGEEKVIQEPVEGYIVKRYRDVYNFNGDKLYSEFLGLDRYSKLDKIIRVGKKKGGKK